MALLKPIPDISIGAFPDLDWNKPAEALQGLFEYLRNDALLTADWYNKKRKVQRRPAVYIRRSAVVLGSLATVLPMLQGLPHVQVPELPLALKPMLIFKEPVMITILIACAAGMIAADRILGFTNTWVRFIKTEGQIRNYIKTFELDWQVERSTWVPGTAQENHPTPAQIATALKLARSFADNINALVQAETQAWSDEFQTGLTQVDDLIKAQSKPTKAGDTAEKSGAILLSVTNGDAFPDGWQVSVVPKAPEKPAVLKGSGKYMAIDSLPPGTLKLEVEATLGEAKKRVEKDVLVLAGNVSHPVIELK